LWYFDFKPEVVCLHPGRKPKYRIIEIIPGHVARTVKAVGAEYELLKAGKRYALYEHTGTDDR